MEKKHVNRMIWTVVVVMALLTGVASVCAFSFGKYEKVEATAGKISIPLKKVADNKAHYYRFEDGGKTINFVVVKGSDGTYRTAFDACDACFKAKKGYEQKGNMLVCKNCNQKFAIDRIGPHAVGGCNPSYLPSTSEGANIVIKAADVQAGGKYF